MEGLFPKDREQVVAVTQQAACHDPRSRMSSDNSYEVRRAGSKRDELLETAMQKLLEHELDVLPVASPEDPARVVGYVERSAILGAWVQLTRHEHIREEGWLARLRRTSP